MKMLQTLLFNIAIFTILDLVHHTIGNTIDCKIEQCQDNIITCNPNEDCFISCDESKSCMGTTIHCPTNGGDCNIYCQGGQACRESIINATLSTGNFNLSCNASTDHCRDIKIYGSILDTNQGDYSITCAGNTRACVSAEITCPLYGDCWISCMDDTSCRWAQIIGPTTGNLNIDCLGVKSCFDAVFDASNSLGLDITGCTADESCFDLSLYCPPNSNGIANCFIEGDNAIGRDNAKGTKIYAKNGWTDIIIDYNGTFGAFHDGLMFCGDDYGIKCSIASDDWACVNYDDYCNFNPTLSTTITNQLNTTHIHVIETQIFVNNNNNNDNTSLYMKIVISIAAVSMICGFIICMKMFRKWFGKTKKTEGEESTSDSFGVIQTIFSVKPSDNDSDPRDFVSEIEGPEVDVFEPGKKHKFLIDPLDSSNRDVTVTIPLQAQRSITDHTFLSAPISELESPNCIPQPHRSSIQNALDEFNIDYDHHAVIQETYITPRPPPRHKKWSADLSPVSSKKSFSSSEGISTVNTSETTQKSQNCDSNNVKPTEDL